MSTSDSITTDPTFNPLGLKIGDTVTWAEPDNDAEAKEQFVISGVEGRFASKVFLDPVEGTESPYGSRSVKLFKKVG